MAAENRYGDILKYGESRISLPPRSGHKSNAQLLPTDVTRFLAGHDIKRNPRLATFQGAQDYAAKNPRRKAIVRDHNNDGIPDVIVAYDMNGDRVWEPNEYTHVNGYSAKRGDWGYRSRYWADREQFPDEFKNDRVGMSQYVEAMHKGFNRDESGKVTWDPDTDRDFFEDKIRAAGQTVKRPRSLTNMQLWKKHIFDPVYHTMTDNVTYKDNGELKKLCLEQQFRYIVVSSRCYNELISGPLLKAATGYSNVKEIDPSGGHTRDVAVLHRVKEFNRIKNSKEFKERMFNVIEDQLANPTASWELVYNYLQYLYESSGLIQLYRPREFGTREIQAVYNDMRQVEQRRTTARSQLYPNLTHARDFRHGTEEHFDDVWKRDRRPQRPDKLAYWHNDYKGGDAYATQHERGGDRWKDPAQIAYHLRRTIQNLQDIQQDHIETGNTDAAAAIQDDIDDHQDHLDVVNDAANTGGAAPPPPPNVETGPTMKFGNAIISSERFSGNFHILRAVVGTQGEISDWLIKRIWKLTGTKWSQWGKDETLDRFLDQKTELGKYLKNTYPKLYSDAIGGNEVGMKTFIKAIHDVFYQLSRPTG
jgi:hypothetical protein